MTKTRAQGSGKMPRPWRLPPLMLFYSYNILMLFHLLVEGVAAGGLGGGGGGGGDLWPLDRPDGMPSIQSLEVMCGKDHMDVHLTFSQPFEGIVSSKGQHGDPRCVYVPPSTGQTFFSFRIAYARCGTKPDLHGQFYENTVVVQYDKDLLEVWDEAKRLRCEWFNDYEKTASKPPMVIADLDVIQLDFRGDNVDCWMEIQHGKGPWAPPVSGIVPLGSTLTLVVAINDYRGEFDMRVKSCVASDGGGHVIQLSDEYGCVLRPKMISRFLKARGADERASVITYAFFHAFKFPDALSVHIKCKVEICRHGCLDHCQVQPDEKHPTVDTSAGFGDHSASFGEHSAAFDLNSAGFGGHSATFGERQDVVPEKSDFGRTGDYDELLGESSNKKKNNRVVVDGEEEETKNKQQQPELDVTAVPHKDMLISVDEFPHGPRTLSKENFGPGGPVAAPRALLTPLQRKKRSVTVSDRKVRSADVGVSGLYEVISEADLAFSPSAEAVTVFQGRIREEVVYGICMPVPGFSVVFVLVAVSAVVSALVAGTLLYRYQYQREQLELQVRSIGGTSSNLFIAWTGWLLRLKTPDSCGVVVDGCRSDSNNRHTSVDSCHKATASK